MNNFFGGGIKFIYTEILNALISSTTEIFHTF